MEGDQVFQRRNKLIGLLEKAGELILEVYAQGEDIEKWSKQDASPVTEADLKSHHFLKEALAEFASGIPLMSEEGQAFDEERAHWKNYWCLDPLDGTKEFLNRNGEFAINLAFMEQNIPTYGFIHVPLSGKTYHGGMDLGAYCTAQGKEESIAVSKKRKNLVALGSRSHRDQDLDNLLQPFDVKEIRSAGSSLKFCLVATGEADIYCRQSPTMEWDTAAGQALVEGAGGRMFKNMETQTKLKYNKTDLTNPGFYCLGW